MDGRMLLISNDHAFEEHRTLGGQGSMIRASNAAGIATGLAETREAMQMAIRTENCMSRVLTG